MQRLTKAQVLALFLGSASAMAEAQFLNGPSSAERVPEGQKLTAASTGAQCNGNSDCIVDKEKCGSFQRADATPKNLCVNSDQKCGAIGRENGINFSITCWDDDVEGTTATAPPTVDPNAYMEEMENLITKTTQNWNGIKNMIVSPKYNYQDGWWQLDEESGKWIENDKMADNRCFLDMQCEPTECCAKYPDTNNRRCIAKSLDKVLVNIGPMSFVPFCPSQISLAPEPIDPGEDLLAEASEKMASWEENHLIDAKRAVDYDNLSEEDKLKFDQEQKAQQELKDEFENELKETIGYNDGDCTKSCQARFLSELLQWEKDIYEICYADKKSIDCVIAKDYKKDEEKARAGKDDAKNYYKNMSYSERVAFNALRKEQDEALKSTLAALQREKHQAKPGEEGGSCSVDIKCADAHTCCGTSTPREGQFVTEKLESVCGNKIMKRYENNLGEEYDHVCFQEGATKLIAVFAAVATIATSLI